MMNARSCGNRLILGIATILLALAPHTTAWARIYDPDSRWDGAGLIGAYLLNPVQLLDSESSSLTVDSKSCGDESDWRVSLVRHEDTGLIGGLMLAWPDETFAYGAAGRLGAHLGAGVGMERRGLKNEEPVYSALVGAMAKVGPASLRVAGSFPLDESQGETAGEAVVALAARAIALRVGYVLGEEPSQGWASLELGSQALRVVYARDFDEAGWRDCETIALRLGTLRYLTLTQQRENGRDEYLVGLGARF